MNPPNLIEKIRKLLALANSSNENEAAVAAEKASVLLAQYNLTLTDIGTDQETEINRKLIEQTSRYITWKMILLTGIAQGNGCEALRNNYTGMMTVVGTPTSLMVCQQLYDYLSKTIERRAKYRKGRGRAYLNAFRVGCATRLSERLIAQREQMEESGIAGEGDIPPTPALVVRSMFEKNQQAINHYFEQQGIHVKTRDISEVSSELGYYSGYQVGDQISLNQQVRSSESVKRLSSSD